MGNPHQLRVLLAVVLAASFGTGCGAPDPGQESPDEDPWFDGDRAPERLDDAAPAVGPADDVAAPSGDDEPLPEELADLEVQAEWHDEHLGN